jgi:hypothetical protein
MGNSNMKSHINILKQLIKELVVLKNDSKITIDDITAWRDKNAYKLCNIYGSASVEVNKFEKISSSIWSEMAGTDEQGKEKAYSPTVYNIVEFDFSEILESEITNYELV